MDRRTFLKASALVALAGAGLACARADGGVLIAYFSRIRDMPEGADEVTHATPWAGNTASVAQAIQRATGGTLHAIETARRYPVLHRENSRQAEAEKDADERPRIVSADLDMGRFQTVFIGFPIWWYQEPMAIRTFVEKYDWKGKTVIPFCTSMAVGIEQAQSHLAALCRGARVLPGRRFATGQAGSVSEAAAWAKSLHW